MYERTTSHGIRSIELRCLACVSTPADTRISNQLASLEYRKIDSRVVPSPEIDSLYMELTDPLGGANLFSLITVDSIGDAACDARMRAMRYGGCDE